MEKPYLRQLEERSPFTVFEVNGAWVRQNKSNEFTNFGQHFRFSFIPKYEFWIDKEHDNSSETAFFIDHLLIEWRLMDKGVSYEDALIKADKVEKRERLRSKLFQKTVKNASYDELIQNTHKELLKSYSNNIKVWIVNGELVRDVFFIDFTEGGHEFVYDFVPKNEVWLDDDLGQTEDRRFVLLHELHERALMSKGIPYDKAHQSASRLEIKTRHQPELLDIRLKQALLENENT